MPAAIPATVAALLDKTADHMDTYGLHKHDPYDMNGWRAGTLDPRRTAVCTGAAISIVGGWLPSLEGQDRPESPAATVARNTFADWLITQGLARRVCHHQPGTYCRDLSCFDTTDTIGGWNDHPARTLDQVTQALRACARRLRPAARITSSTCRPRLAIEAALGGTR